MNMTAVIALADWPREAKAREAFEGSAQIFIFNGVRVERLHEEVQMLNHKARLPSRHNQATAEELE